MSELQWPPGFDRTPPHQRRGYPGGFKVSRRLAFDSIVDELEKMDAVNVDVQTAAPHTAKHPHQPYQDRDPEDPGVVVYFDREGQRYAVPCDRWDNLRDNARAIAKYLDAKRAIERYGVATVETEMSTQALPAGDDDVIVAGNGKAQEPHEILDVSPDAPPAVVKGAARSLKAQYHPDQPDGDREKFQQVQDAEEAMLEERARTDGGEPDVYTWLGRLQGIAVREPGRDANGPILELHGDELPGAVEVADSSFVAKLTRAAVEIGEQLDTEDEGNGGDDSE